MRHSIIHSFTILLCYLIIVGATQSSLADDELSESQFRKIHSEIVPDRPAWKSIPWHADLVSAQKVAIDQDKPLFIWSMDGHPLGCT